MIDGDGGPGGGSFQYVMGQRSCNIAFVRTSLTCGFRRFTPRALVYEVNIYICLPWKTCRGQLSGVEVRQEWLVYRPISLDTRALHSSTGTPHGAPGPSERDLMSTRLVPRGRQPARGPSSRTSQVRSRTMTPPQTTNSLMNGALVPATSAPGKPVCRPRVLG